MKRAPLKRPRPEVIRIGLLEFTIPAGMSKARRRLFIAAAEAHVLETGMITVVDAREILAKYDRRTARIVRQISQREPRKHSTYASRPRDTSFMVFVKTQPCAAISTFRMPWLPVPLDTRTLRAADCRGAIEADHMGRRPIGRKATDDTCVPMCTAHHVARTGHSGLFRDATKEQLRTWTADWITEIQGRYAQQSGQT